MPLAMEDLRVLKTAETVADNVWKRVARWGPFARDAIGLQLVRAADSIGANIAEAFGRYRFDDKLNFLYYARGSLFETKYWLNRSLARDLVDAETVEAYAEELAELAKQLNALAAVTRKQRSVPPPDRSVQEPEAAYLSGDSPLEADGGPPILTGGAGPAPAISGTAATGETGPDLDHTDLFSPADLDWLGHST